MSSVSSGDANGEAAPSGEKSSAAHNEKQRLFEASPELQALCRDNGISEQQFARRSDAVTTLEMFLGFWESMKSVTHFPALRELYIVNHPTIRVLEGVDACVNLEVLVVTECSLAQIGSSIARCTKLRTVNLSSNRLRKLENLDTLEQLEILWVNENALETLEGLRKLTKLSQLWACRNQLDRLDTVLNACSSLKELNLAGNRLNSFKSLLPLANLDGLSVLTLSDPHFGDNPVCRLCNYQTSLMCHLSCLAFLDTMEVSPRSKQIAEATMAKKKVYYNMRIRSIRRDVRAQIQRYETIRSHAEQQLDANVMTLMRQKKEIECFLSEHQQSFVDGAPRENQAAVQLEKKVECLDVCLKQQYSAIHRLNLEFDRLCADLLQVSDRNASRLLLELETAGNIRLEDGKASDAWYSSCVDLVSSRLFSDELKKFGIADVRIGRVTRVSNRFLRNRFHSRMEEIVVVPELDAKENVSKKGVTVHSQEDKASLDDQQDSQAGSLGEYVDTDQLPRRQYPGSSLDKSVEYLFYLHPHRLDQIVRSSSEEQYFVAENGFRDPNEYAKAGLDGAIKLSNSIALLDTERIQAELSERGKPNGRIMTELGASDTNDAPDFNALLPTRVLTIVKAFPGYTKCMSDAEVTKTAKGAATMVRSEEYAGLHSLQLLPPADATATDAPSFRQKVYYVFDKALVLPEYLVEYQYVMRGDNAISTHMNGTESCSRPTSNVSEAASHEEDFSASANCTDLSSDEEYAATGMASQLADAFERKYRTRRRYGVIDDNGADESIARVLQMGPMLPETASTVEGAGLSVVSSKMKALELGNIKSINLIGCKLQAIPNLSAVSERLETLVLSYNHIQTTAGLAGLSCLRALDLSFNQIGQLGHLDTMRSLDSLDISHNLLKAFGNVEYLGRTFVNSSLRRLDLRKNALCDSKRYRLHVLQSLPFLAQLDHQAVGKHEVTVALQLITKLSSAKIWDLCSRCDINLSPTSRAAESLKAVPDGPESEDDEQGASSCKESLYNVEAWTTVEQVALGRELIARIEGLELAVNLRVATFADNVISSISGLETCRRLEELCLDDNEVERIERLEHLTMLKKLYLGRNRISAIEGLDRLENLVQLSLEDNHIASLRGLGGLMKLMELYLCNNKIEILKDIQHLKSLPKLTILDLTGNEICRVPDYRVYTVYYLRRVKVLDGVTVSAQDQSTAKQKYSGKLTLEYIMDKCGIGGALTPLSGSGFERIVEMDLSSCRLRELDVLSGKNFPNVRDINLENNQISDISGMEALPSLRKLNLNRNRIERLAPVAGGTPRSSSNSALLKGILACTKLEHLYLGYNRISDMSALGLQFLQDLKVLHLQGNSIVQLSGLGNSIELQDLRLDKNRIRQVDTNSVLSLRQLCVLSVEDNGLKTLSTFNNMISLEVLEASNNRLGELEEIDWLVPLRALTDLRVANNPMTKKHMYRPSVINRLAGLTALDGREVTPDERERATTLFAHERAAAAVTASVANYTSGERVIDARGGYQSVASSAVALAPSSLPTRPAVSMAGTGAYLSTSSAAPLAYDALSGSLLRRSSVVPSPFAPVQVASHSGLSIPSPDQQVELKMAIAPSHTTTKSLMPSTQGITLRGMAVHSNQANGSTHSLGSKTHLASPSGTVTVASTLNASSTFALYGGAAGGAGGGQRPERRRLSSVHYDQPIAGVGFLPGAVGSSPCDAKLPASQTFKSPGGLIKQGLSLHPSSAEAVLSKAGSSFSKAKHSSKDASDSVNAASTGYVMTYGDQKRYPGYQGTHPEASTSIPYLSTKLQQHAEAGNSGGGRIR